MYLEYWQILLGVLLLPAAIALIYYVGFGLFAGIILGLSWVLEKINYILNQYFFLGGDSPDSPEPSHNS